MDKILEERGVDRDALQKVSLSVGFPLLEKASYQDDEFLQYMWANLLASSMEKFGMDSDGFSLDVTYVEILHQFSRIDCEVLEYLSENGISERVKKTGTMLAVAIDPSHLKEAFPNRLAHIALEKFVSLGCAYRVLRTPLSPRNAGPEYGPLGQDIVVTLIGVNLYIAASGKKPQWYDKFVRSDVSSKT